MEFPLLKQKEKNRAESRTPVEVIRAEADKGLTSAQAERRAELGYANTPPDPPGKTAKQIVISNVFTFFNLIFLVLAGFVIAVGAWKELLFIPVIVFNTVIGIVQELRSKAVIDKLTLLSAPSCTVIRDGRERTVGTGELVRDDVVIFRTGDQICADAEVITGACQANEALVTGEADEIKKSPGDKLLSGSFLVSGSCRARLTAVGADSYASRLTAEAKSAGRRKQSEMMRSLTKLVKWIGIIILPFGVLLCVKEVSWLGRSFSDGVVSTVGALTGMIPEGLYLLTSIALAASVLRLALKKTLVHELSCVETLARVDVLCVDKTGTITENKMEVESVHPLCPERYTMEDIGLIMTDYVAAMRDDNDTMAALRVFFQGKAQQAAIGALPFTSAKKFGGVSFHEDETYLLGAPEILLGVRCEEYADLITKYSAKGCRVLLLAHYGGALTDGALTAPMLPLALILLNNKLRPEARETFSYFASQGVAIKVISGDNPLTVSEVAGRAGIEGASRHIDARTLQSDEDIAAAVENYTVFGRVTPDQKRRIVRALKARGHTVAMTGDGVNDVLALKDADCSIAMAAGSDAASRVSDIVLLENNFAVMPSAVAEGRRVINNIQRSATLFLVKNLFSMALALVTILFVMPYPLRPSQISLVSTLTIGLPGFVLAMEPDVSRIKGHFLRNVLYRAVPPALTDFVLVIGVLLFYYAFDLSHELMGTICAILMGFVGIFVIIRICKPWTLIRKILIGLVCAAFAFCIFFLRELFSLTQLDFPGWLLLVVFVLLAWPALQLFYRGWDKLTGFFREKLGRKAKRKERIKA